MLLARNTAPDRLKAIGYTEQAIVVLEEHGGDNDDDEVITPLFPQTVTHSRPVTRHIRWMSVIGCLPLAITRGSSASSTASPYALRASFTCFQVFACWMMLGDGSRPVVGYVGMFQMVQSEQKKCVTPVPFFQPYSHASWGTDYRYIYSSHESLWFVIYSRSDCFSVSWCSYLGLSLPSPSVA